MTMGLSRFSSVSSFRAVDRALKGPDLALNGPHGPRGYPGFAGGRHAKSIWSQPEVLGFGQHLFAALSLPLLVSDLGPEVGVTRDLR
jgi:hypothetical protein